MKGTPRRAVYTAIGHRRVRTRMFGGEAYVKAVAYTIGRAFMSFLSGIEIHGVVLLPL